MDISLVPRPSSAREERGRVWNITLGGSVPKAEIPRQVLIGHNTGCSTTILERTAKRATMEPTADHETTGSISSTDITSSSTTIEPTNKTTDRFQVLRLHRPAPLWSQRMKLQNQFQVLTLHHPAPLWSQQLIMKPQDRFQALTLHRPAPP